jgi:hypothetical protein
MWHGRGQGTELVDPDPGLRKHLKDREVLGITPRTKSVVCSSDRGSNRATR